MLEDIKISKVVPAKVAHGDVSGHGMDYYLALAFLPDDDMKDSRFAFAKFEVTFSDPSKRIAGVPDLSIEIKIRLLEEAVEAMKRKIANA